MYGIRIHNVCIPKVYEKNSVPALLEMANKLYKESLLFSDSAATAAPEEWENNEECSDSSSALDVSPNCCGGKPGSINTRCCPSNEICSTDPSLATYYLASNMTINDAQKQQLLDAENIVIRLRYVSVSQNYWENYYYLNILT